MKNLQNLFQNFSKLNGENQKNFLDIFFTKSEIKTFQERINIFEKLKKGETQRKISSDLKISITTVTRGNKAFKEMKNEIKKLF